MKLGQYIQLLFLELFNNHQKAKQYWEVCQGDLQTFVAQFLPNQKEFIPTIMEQDFIITQVYGLFTHINDGTHNFIAQCQSVKYICLDYLQKQQFLKSKKKQRENIPICKLDEKQLNVMVNYYTNKMDLNYEHNGYVLKNCLQEWIKKFLRQISRIQVFSARKSVNILHETQYMKSQDAGNYKFDPLCGSIRINLIHSKNETIESNIIISNPDKIQIAYNPLEGHQKEISQSLQGSDSIQKLIKMLCQKKQQSKANQEYIINSITKGQGVKTIREFYSWVKEDYHALKIQIKWIYDLLEIIQQIKYNDKESIENQINKISSNIQKANCIKTANSHKILRYIVYKTFGFGQLNRLAKLNYQNMKKAIQIVKQEIINEELLNQLEDYFYQFTDIPQKGAKKMSTSRGIILFGPPGTGKTQLTQSLPQLIGFHLIGKGLSAADFMKPLVGKAKQMVKDLVNRAKCSPHLLCSIGIDEIDGLVPDRKDKDQKNKGEIISMLLSVIGGNSDVPNLIFMASTNYLKKIDQAIRRRFSGQFQVGRPNPSARLSLIINDLPFLKYRQEFLQKLVLITTNFTGAAIKRLNTLIYMKMKRKGLQKGSYELTMKQIIQGATQIAKQFSITLGMYTFPQLYALTSQNNQLTYRFLDGMPNKFLMIKYETAKQYKIFYSTEQSNKFQQSQYQEKKLNINLQFSGIMDHFDVLFHKMKKTFENKLICYKLEGFKDYVKTVSNKKQPILLVIKHLQQQSAIKDHIHSYFTRQKDNLHIIYYIGLQEPDKFLNLLKWKKGLGNIYTGRILVQFKQNQQPRMGFQLKVKNENQTTLHFKKFLKTQKTHTANDIIPELIEFFVKRQVSYTLLLDYQLILQNNAFDQQKIFEVIQQKMNEATNYSKIAVIINLDSLIILNKSSSDSSMGQSKSYSIADNNMYRFLLHYMRELAVVDIQGTMKRQKWIAIISKNPHIIQLIKSDLTWPTSPQQQYQYRQDKLLNQQKKCRRCGIHYTQKQNLKERKCMQHPGYIINLNTGLLMTHLTVNDARLQELKEKKKKRKKDDDGNNMEDVYIFACCMKGINEGGQCSYRHVSQIEFEKKGSDELYDQRAKRIKQWQTVAEKLKSEIKIIQKSNN